MFFKDNARCGSKFQLFDVWIDLCKPKNSPFYSDLDQCNPIRYIDTFLVCGLERFVLTSDLHCTRYTEFNFMKKRNLSLFTYTSAYELCYFFWYFLLLFHYMGIAKIVLHNISSFILTK